MKDKKHNVWKTNILLGIMQQLQVTNIYEENLLHLNWKKQVKRTTPKSRRKEKNKLIPWIRWADDWMNMNPWENKNYQIMKTMADCTLGVSTVNEQVQLHLNVKISTAINSYFDSYLYELPILTKKWHKLFHTKQWCTLRTDHELKYILL